MPADTSNWPKSFNTGTNGPILRWSPIPLTRFCGTLISASAKVKTQVSSHTSYVNLTPLNRWSVCGQRASLAAVRAVRCSVFRWTGVIAPVAICLKPSRQMEICKPSGKIPLNLKLFESSKRPSKTNVSTVNSNLSAVAVGLWYCQKEDPSLEQTINVRNDSLLCLSSA